FFYFTRIFAFGPGKTRLRADGLARNTAQFTALSLRNRLIPLDIAVFYFARFFPRPHQLLPGQQPPQSAACYAHITHEPEGCRRESQHRARRA
ncbi:MAG: hypothetical protein WBW68_13335, partial [Terracidiphilus sp.]